MAVHRRLAKESPSREVSKSLFYFLELCLDYKQPKGCFFFALYMGMNRRRMEKRQKKENL